jgi:hypothetical protein
MSNITSVESTVFVTYAIAPVPGIFKESLNEHLNYSVWGYMGNRVDEDICVNVYSFEGESWISEIRYQFGEIYDEFYAKEIGSLIEKEIGVWAAKTNVYDIVAD